MKEPVDYEQSPPEYPRRNDTWDVFSLIAAIAITWGMTLGIAAFSYFILYKSMCQ